MAVIVKVIGCGKNVSLGSSNPMNGAGLLGALTVTDAVDQSLHAPSKSRTRASNCWTPVSSRVLGTVINAVPPTVVSVPNFESGSPSPPKSQKNWAYWMPESSLIPLNVRAILSPRVTVLGETDRLPAVGGWFD